MYSNLDGEKFNRKKIVFLLACASVLGGKTQAANKNNAQSPKTVSEVGRWSDKNLNKGLISWVKNHKWQLGGQYINSCRCDFIYNFRC